MPYTPHVVVKPQVIAKTGIGLLQNELTLAKLVSVKGVDEFKGTLNDTLTEVIPGLLPARSYDFRNDRSLPIEYDVYKEATVSVNFGGRRYSAVKITDEQKDFDLKGDFGRVLNAQTQAVATELNQMASDAITRAAYKYVIGGAEADLRGALIEARRVLNALRVPAEQRYLVVGGDFEAAMLNDEKITSAKQSGDNVAEGALREAIVGRLFGFTVVLDQSVPVGEAYAFVPSAFFLRTAAPSIPQGAPFGATTSYDGFAMRWLMDYDTDYLTDRSVVDVWAGTAVAEDFLYPTRVEPSKPFDPSALKKYFLRGVKLTLGGTSTYATEVDLKTQTGLTKAWAPKAPAATPAH